MANTKKAETVSKTEIGTAPMAKKTANSKKRPYAISDETIGSVIKKDTAKKKTSLNPIDELLNGEMEQPNKDKRLTKTGTYKLTHFDKATRNIIKQNLNDEYGKLLSAFYDALNQPNTTQADIKTRLSSYCKTIFVNFPKINIKFTGGTIDLRTIPKAFRNKYKEAERQRKEKFAETLKTKLSTSPRLTIGQAEELKRRGMEVKKPFKGKFKN